MITCSRYHDFSAGHRVVGHENKCKYLHGHNYRVTFTCRAEALDPLGRVIDFGVMKTKLCNWLEDNWDHRMLMWSEDPYVKYPNLVNDPSIVQVPFNPTAENMAEYLLRMVGLNQLSGTGVELVEVEVSETRKCSARAKL